MDSHHHSIQKSDPRTREEKVPRLWYGDFAVFVVLAVLVFMVVGRVGTLQIIALIIMIPAFVLWLLSRLNLGESFSMTPQAKKLKTDGMYRWFRHPVYVFSLLSLFALCLYSQIWWLWIFFTLMLTLQIIRMKKEEEILEKTFGQDYRNYKKKTLF